MFDQDEIDFGIKFLMNLGSIFGSSWASNFLPLGFSFSIQLGSENLIISRSDFCSDLISTSGGDQVEVETAPLSITFGEAASFVFDLDHQLELKSRSCRCEVEPKI